MAFGILTHDMGLWDRLFGRRVGHDLTPQRLDYLNEALALERQGDYEAALTSYRLALRDHPADPRVLQNMAIAFTKTNRHDEAIRHYRKALAFLLIKRGDHESAGKHLKEFLGRPPRGPDAAKWIEHAERALAEVEGSGGLKP
jgi:tetratricopeptide (TPR) repeat protein